MKTFILLFIVTVLFGYSTYCNGQTATEHASIRANGPASFEDIPDSITVPLDEAYRMVANYAPRAGFVPDSGRNDLPNTRAVWLDIGRMETLVRKLRREHADGIRIYFGAYSAHYPDGTSETNLPPKGVWGYNTVLLVSTRDSLMNGQHYHWDYYTDQDNKTMGRPGDIVATHIQNRTFNCPTECEGAELLNPPTP